MKMLPLAKAYEAHIIAEDSSITVPRIRGVYNQLRYTHIFTEHIDGTDLISATSTPKPRRIDTSNPRLYGRPLGTREIECGRRRGCRAAAPLESGTVVLPAW